MAVSDLLVAISNASRVAFPDKLSVMASNLKAVTVVLSFCLVPHETQKRHVNRSHAKLKGFKMETEILTKTVEDLTRKEVTGNHFVIMKLKEPDLQFCVQKSWDCWLLNATQKMEKQKHKSCSHHKITTHLV